MPPFEKHIFICCNQREPGHPRGSCDPQATDALQKAFKKAIAERGLNARIRANKAGCLDQCEHGPTVVIYPDTVWYGRVTADDIGEIVDRHLIGGEPVERLRLPDECINTATCPHKPRGKTEVPKVPGAPEVPTVHAVPEVHKTLAALRPPGTFELP
jgi:(2Fe-2S) ferredoxin